MVEYRIAKASYVEPQIGRGFIPLNHAQSMIDKGFKLTPIKEGTVVVGWHLEGTWSTYTEQSTGDRIFTQDAGGREYVRHDCPMEDAEPDEPERAPYAGKQ